MNLRTVSLLVVGIGTALSMAGKRVTTETAGNPQTAACIELQTRRHGQ